MDFKQIQDLIKLVNKSNISEIKVEEDDFKITIRTKEYAEGFRMKGEIAATPTQIAVPVQSVPPPVQSAEAKQETPPLEEKLKKETEQAGPVEKDQYITIKSPMIGTFYRSSAPDKDPFVQVGDLLASGKVICIIEAMKLFNEIESEVEGKVVKVLVEDATPVEYDQPLFLIDPTG